MSKEIDFKVEGGQAIPVEPGQSSLAGAKQGQPSASQGGQSQSLQASTQGQRQATSQLGSRKIQLPGGGQG